MVAFFVVYKFDCVATKKRKYALSAKKVPKNLHMSTKNTNFALAKQKVCMKELTHV